MSWTSRRFSLSPLLYVVACRQEVRFPGQPRRGRRARARLLRVYFLPSQVTCPVKQPDDGDAVGRIVRCVHERCLLAGGPDVPRCPESATIGQTEVTV